MVVSEENLSMTRDLSETDTILNTVLRKTAMDELNLSRAISEEKLSMTMGPGRNRYYFGCEGGSAL